ncbi:MAG: hypothetical protein GX202_09830 [Firmicutes bacterium]|nr:hypothetical protein [Bacillota bacterium]
MAEIKWRTMEEIEAERNTPPPPTVEDLKAELEKLKEEKKMTDLALLELVEMLLG